MLEAKQFSRGLLEDVARQAAGRLQALSGKREGQFDLGDTFEVWMLPAKAIAQAATERIPIDLVAIFTERVHHQVEFNKIPFGFVRSKLVAENLVLTEVHISNLAQRIEAGLTSIPGRFEKVVRTRLLVIPAYYMHAMMLAEKDEGITRVLMMNEAGGKKLHRNAFQLLTSNEFLQYLQEAPVPRGVLR